MSQDVMNVLEAARYVGRTPETVRRWVWSGRLLAGRQGRRLVVARADLDALLGRSVAPSLAEWAAGLSTEGAGSAADLVLADRDARAGH